MKTVRNGKDITKQLEIRNENYHETIYLRKGFFNETYSKNIRNRRIAETMELATKIQEWMPSARCVNQKEPGVDHQFDFVVFETYYNNIHIQCKAKKTEGTILYTMRIID